MGNTALEVPAPASLAQQTFAPMAGYTADDVRGKEGITKDMLRLAFLSIAQKTSKAIDETDDAYIDGLKFGDLYNSETKENYGRVPLAFVTLRLLTRAHLPLPNGRLGERIDWNDQRCNWPTPSDIKARFAAGYDPKKIDKPEGIRVIDAVVILLLPGGYQPAVISFKGKSFGAGQRLTSFISMVQGPAFTAKFEVVSVFDENDAGKFGKFDILTAGKPSLGEAQFAERHYETMKDRVIDVTVDTAIDENEAAPVTDNDIPF